MSKTAPADVRLGYALETGEPVDIPIRHMVVTGQTQEAGKTTTLEALILRSGRRALAFQTKRGEGAFGGARTIAPYFREAADWRFVSSMLEAFLGERMKFERAWIMRATKGAKTLADVRANLIPLLQTARGMSADMYMQLAEYLRELAPVIASVPWARGIVLSPGVNVMDLADLPVTMQHLVIQSAIDWVHARERHTVIVVPEAWQFIPQGRNTPVRRSAMTYIRQGAALANYLWLDSQDIAGVDKELLRSCPVWLLGVQREHNEIKRTLANIPASVAKPSAAAIATLTIGQFVAAWGKHAVRVYVQPKWLPEAHAIRIATGEESVSDEYERDARPRRRPGPPAPVIPIAPRVDRSAESRFIVESKADLFEQFAAQGRRAQQAVDAARTSAEKGDDMTAEQEQKLDRILDALVKLASGRHLAKMAEPDAGLTRRAYTAGEAFDNEALYQAFKTRLLEEAATDPRVLEILTTSPEIRVSVERHTIQMSGSTLQGRLALLLHEGWFDSPHTSGDAQAELGRRGFGALAPNITRELAALARMGFLTRDNKWYRAVPAMKRSIEEVDETPAAAPRRRK